MENNLHCHLLEQQKQNNYPIYIYIHTHFLPCTHTNVFFYCSSYLSTCQRSHTGDVSSIKRLGSLYKYTSGNFRLSRALDKQLPVLLTKCIVYMVKKPAPLRTKQCYPAFLQEPPAACSQQKLMSSSNHLCDIYHLPPS